MPIDHFVGHHQQQPSQARTRDVVRHRSEQEDSGSGPKSREEGGPAGFSASLVANRRSGKGARPGETGKKSPHQITHALPHEFAVEIEALPGLGRDRAADRGRLDQPEQGQCEGSGQQVSGQLPIRGGQELRHPEQLQIGPNRLQVADDLHPPSLPFRLIPPE